MTLRFTTLQQSVIALCGSRTGGICRAPSIALDTNGTHCIFAISCNGASWASLLSVLPSGYPGLPADTDIFFKMAWDGSTWSGLVDDGTTVMTNSASLGTPYFNSTDRFYFATQGGTDAYAVKTGTFDMTKDLYMKQNGVLIWGREG